jgi:hypothetical protein
MPLGHAAIPSAVVAGDGFAGIRAVAPVADQVSPREREDRDVGHEDRRKHRQHHRPVGEAQQAHRRTEERQHDDHRGDDRERLLVEEVRTAARDAATEVAAIVDGRVPLQEHLAARFNDRRPHGAGDGVHLQVSQRPSMLVAKRDPHAGRILLAGGGEPPSRRPMRWPVASAAARVHGGA